MSLVLIILLPFAGAIIAFGAGRFRANLARWIALITLGTGLAMTAGYWPSVDHSGWFETAHFPWVPTLGIGISVAIDGLSMLLVILTYVLGLIAVLVSWNSISERVAFFHFNLLWVVAGTNGVFLATDLFLFFFCWEMMVLPMFLLIGIWGHANRNYAAIKFFLFTQASGLLLLVAIVSLVFINYAGSGELTFHYEALLDAELTAAAQMWLMLGFFIAFAVKLPAIPFHTWLADAHSEAPTGGSVILAGVLLKTGGYGLIRFVGPLFPEATSAFAPVGMALGAIGILYGAVLAFAQTDLKRLIAYSSVSHMGFVMLGVFSWNAIALHGTVIQMLCHGLSTGALFIIAGCIYDRVHTRDLSRMGGFRDLAPRMAAFGLFFTMASLGLPGIGNFVGEFLILLGAFQANIPLTAMAVFGLVGATLYSLRLFRRVFLGPRDTVQALSDLDRREFAVLAVLLLALLWIGLFPKPIQEAAEHGLRTEPDAAAVAASNASETQWSTRLDTTTISLNLREESHE